MVRATLLAAVLAAAASAAVAAPETAVDFGQRMAATVAAHPDVISARRALDAAELGVDAARAGYFPRVSVSTDLGRDSTVNATGSGTDSVSRRAVDVTLRQNLYTGGKLTAQVGMARAEQTQLRVALRQARQKIALEALSAHLQVARTSLLMALAGASERATEGLLGLETRRVELGGGTRADSDFARTRLSLARERTRQNEVQAEEAINAYRLVFLDEPRIAELADLGLLKQRLPADLAEAVALALANHPDLRAAELQRERALHKLELERAQRLPTVELVAARRIDNVPPAQASGRTDSTIGVKLNYSLYSGGESQARIGAAQAQLDAQAEAIVNARRGVEANVRTYHRRLSGAVERVDLLQQAADDAHNVFANRRRLREFGRETAVAVLDAQLEYNNVLIGLVNASFDGRLNAIRLAHALGLLAEEDGVATWFADFVEPRRPLDALRQRVDEAGRIDTGRPAPSAPPVEGGKS